MIILGTIFKGLIFNLQLVEMLFERQLKSTESTEKQFWDMMVTVFKKILPRKTRLNFLVNFPPIESAISTCISVRYPKTVQTRILLLHGLFHFDVWLLRFGHFWPFWFLPSLPFVRTSNMLFVTAFHISVSIWMSMSTFTSSSVHCKTSARVKRETKPPRQTAGF